MPKTKEQEKSEAGKLPQFTEAHADRIEKIVPLGRYIIFVPESEDADTLCIRSMSDIDVGHLMVKLGDYLLEPEAHDVLIAVQKVLINRGKQHTLAKLFTHPHDPPNHP